MAKKEHKTQKH